MGKDVIVACDFADKDRLAAFLKCFKGKKPYLKIGMEMFYANGPDLVKKLKDDGCKIFLDLKLHDIPNTVSSAMRALSPLEIDMINVHATGGVEMMKAAANAFEGTGYKKPKIIAVTILTSISDEMLKNELCVSTGLKETVSHYALNASHSGLDGVVCSPNEADEVHKLCTDNFLTVTPGVRYPENDRGDQVRVADPKTAKLKTADYIVVGRPITKSDDPLGSYEKFCNDFIG